MPTLTHAAIAELVKNGTVKFVTTSNHDDLHYKSGTGWREQIKGEERWEEA